jgi:hypothetical protein
MCTAVIDQVVAIHSSITITSFEASNKVGSVLENVEARPSNPHDWYIYPESGCLTYCIFGMKNEERHHCTEITFPCEH